LIISFVAGRKEKRGASFLLYYIINYAEYLTISLSVAIRAASPPLAKSPEN
jgi:hypothetical protein